MSGSFVPPSSSGVPSYTPEAETAAYQSNLTTAGATISVASLYAVDKFIKGCKSDSLWSTIIDCGVFASNSLTGALIKLVGTGSYTNFNFVSGDYSEVRGLQGNGTSKYLSTGVLATSLSATSGTICVWLNSIGSSSYSMILSLNSACANGNPSRIYARSDGNTGVAYAANGAETQSYGTAGLYAIGALSGSEHGYRNGFRFYSGAVVSSTTFTNNTQPYYLFAQNNTGTPTAYLDGNISFCSFHNRGLTPQEHRWFFLKVAALQVALGRAV